MSLLIQFNMGVISYLVIGSMFTMLVDIGSVRYTDLRFNWAEKIACILVWPIALLAFIWGWFNSNK
jgi:hypothetical protein|tara:strand:+ start:159 stop:356 length:198 start_codon:yes stop_codon:yes gene_type:complete